jgi:hypothetical protein
MAATAHCITQHISFNITGTCADRGDIHQRAQAHQQDRMVRYFKKGFSLACVDSLFKKSRI